MINKLKPKSEFSRNVLTLMTGTTIAQAIPIAISPILTRLYTPEDFGVFALFISITSILGSISAGRYELAIMLPKKDEDAINIFALGFIITSFISLSLLILVIIFNDYFVKLLNNEEIKLWLYFVPIAVFFTGIYNILNYFNNRKKYYKDISNATILKSIITAIIQLSVGFLKGGVSGLISGQLISQMFANIRLFKNVFKDKILISKISKIKIIALAKRYKNFPKFSMWSGLLNIASLQIPILILTVFFGATIVGFYALSHRLLSMPMSFIGSSIGQVFYQKSVEIKNNRHMLSELTFNTYKKLFLIGILPFSIITVFGDYLFAFVFGSSWITAGEYAQVLAIWILFVFITSPLTNLFSTLEKQKEGLYFNIAIFLSRIIVLLIGGLILQNAYYTILIYGIVGAIFWMFWGFYLLSIVGVKLKESFSFTFKYLLLSIISFSILKVYIWM